MYERWKEERRGGKGEGEGVGGKEGGGGRGEKGGEGRGASGDNLLR